HLANLIHLIEDAVQDRLDFFVRLLLKEWALAFEPSLVTQEFFLIEIGNLSFFALFDFHEAGTITPHASPCKYLFKDLVHGLRVRSAACRLHHLSDKESEVAGLTEPVLLDRFWIILDDLRDDLFDFV